MARADVGPGLVTIHVATVSCQLHALFGNAQRMRHRGDESDTDLRTMAVFHYRQELRRSIRLFGSFAVAFSFISITTGIFANYGFVLRQSGPAGIWTWPIVVVGQLLVALVFADLAACIPLTGYSYQWVTRLAGPGWGWFAGWLAVCFLIIVIPSVDHGLASVLGHVLGVPDDSLWLKGIVCATIAVQAAIHIVGVRLADRVNSAAVVTEVGGMLGLVLVLGAVAAVNRPSPGILFDRANVDGPYFTAWIMASLMGAYTLVGFESAANLAEETVDAATTVPRAIVSSVLVSGVVGMLFLVVTVLGIRDAAALSSAAYPLPTIIQNNLGVATSHAFFVLIAISIFACGLVIMASASRLVFALARDGVFLANGLFRRVTRRTATPVPAVLLVSGLGIVVELTSDSLEQLLACAAVLPALVYLVTVVAFALGRHKRPARLGSFSLGRWEMPAAALAALWLVGVIAILTIPREFHAAAAMSLVICLAGVVLYWTVVRRRIERGEAGIHRSDLPAS